VTGAEGARAVKEVRELFISLIEMLYYAYVQIEFQLDSGRHIIPGLIER
jgi:hypothetical protein